jgi:hypothetical protein
METDEFDCPGRCNLTPPGPNDFEISVWGPGFGEALAVHMPGGKWILIDSCRNATGVPVSLEYLRSIHVDISTQVSHVIATHWHWDHVDGLSEVLEAATEAEFVMSAALELRELLAYAGVSEYLPRVPKAIEELRRMMAVVKSGSRTVRLAQSRTVLHRSTGTTVEVLSPSPHAVHEAISEVSTIASAGVDAVERLPNAAPNGAAMVVQASANGVSALLGSDLEVDADPARGWTALYRDNPRLERSSLLKVAHHGSTNGSSSILWEKLVTDTPIGIVTDFHNGSVHLPKPAARAELAERTTLFSTNGQAPPDALMKAEEALPLLGKLNQRSRQIGHVRARSGEAGAGWVVSCCGSAQCTSSCADTMTSTER